MAHRGMLTVYSAAHGVVDFSCAFLVYRAMGDHPDLALFLLLYNFCAFALQMPLGLLADGWNKNSLVAAAGCLLVTAAYLPPLPGMGAAVLAGVGNGLFHVGGGLDVLNDSGERAAALGIFVSPGALGLYVGGLLGRGGQPGLWLPPALLALCAILILTTAKHTYGGLASRNAPPELMVPTGGKLAAALLFLVVVLRSYMGMNQSFWWKGEGVWPLLLVVAAVAGKAAGGFLCDRVGPRQAAVLSLGLSALLYLGSGVPALGTAAVLCFNMTMPVTLWAVARLMPGAKGFSFGLLTFGLFLGFLPSWLGWPSPLGSGWSYALLSLASAALLLPGLRGERGGGV